MPNPELSPEQFFEAGNQPEGSTEAREASISQTYEAVEARIGEIEEEYPPEDDFDSFSDKMVEARDRFPGASPEGELIIVSFFGVAAEIRRTQERASLQEEAKRAASQGRFQDRSRFLDRIEQLNISSADWQINAGRMILMLERQTKELEILKNFWQRVGTFHRQAMPQIIRGRRSEGELMASKLKSGVLAPLTTIHILRAMQLEVSFPTARQDAVDKIDLWAWRESGGKPKKALAIQVKTASALGAKEGRDEQKTKQKLINECEGYSSRWGMTVKPIWLEMLPANTEGIDELNGRPSQEFIDEQVEGEFGEAINKALRIKKK